MKKLFSIIIPNYNGKEYLKECLDSLDKQALKDFEIIVVDDASTDDSFSFIRKSYPQVRVLQMGKNSGFSKVVNRGIQEARGEYIFLLNNDTRLDKDCIEEINKAIQRYPEYDIYACKILNMSDPQMIDSAGDGYSIIGNPFKIGYKKKDSPEYQKPKEVFGACAAASIYKRSLFEEIGYFDEDFAFYNEDSDINFRACLRGHRCLYIPTAVVHHRVSASYKKKLGAVIYYICRNKINLIVKDMPTSLIIKYFPLLILGRMRDLAMAASKGKFITGISGMVGALWQLPLMLKKRKEIQKARQISDKELEKYLLK